MNRYLTSILVQARYCREATAAEKVRRSITLPAMRMAQNQSSKKDDRVRREEATGVPYGK